MIDWLWTYRISPGILMFEYTQAFILLVELFVTTTYFIRSRWLNFRKHFYDSQLIEGLIYIFQLYFFSKPRKTLAILEISYNLSIVRACSTSLYLELEAFVLKLYIVIICHCTCQKVSMVLKVCFILSKKLNFFKKIIDSKINFSSCLKCHLYCEEIIPLGKYETLEKLWDKYKKNQINTSMTAVFQIFIEYLTLDYLSYHFTIAALSQRWLCPSPGHIWQCLETFFVIILRGWNGSTGI